jgi:hypothetical protein
MARPAAMKKLISTAALSITLLSAFSARVLSQDTGSLLDLVKDSVEQTEFIKNAFKSTRIINGQSIEMLGAGSLDFRILHRFGPINSGPDNFFGLDQSSVRLSFDYAPYNDLLVGIGRSTARKELDGFVKYRLLQQSIGARVFPITVVLVAGMTLWTGAFEDETVANYFTSRMGFFQQVLIGRKFSDLFTLQLSPTLIHENFVPLTTDSHDIFALGVGGRIRLTNRISMTVDWYHPFHQLADGFYDPLAIGFDIETGGHVFQVHLSNSVGMNERAFITETTGNWLKGGIRMGFNISRVFQL